MSEFIEPVVTDTNRGFWEGTAAGELRVQRCLACEHAGHQSADGYRRCSHANWEWQPLSGRGTVMSRLIFHQSYHPAWKERLPYNVVLVQLEEGPRMISNVAPLSEQGFAVGDALEVVFEPEGDIVIPRFRLAAA